MDPDQARQNVRPDLDHRLHGCQSEMYSCKKLKASRNISADAPKKYYEKNAACKDEKIMFTYHIFTLNIQTDIAEQDQPLGVGYLIKRNVTEGQLSVTGKNYAYLFFIYYCHRSI